MSRKSDRPEYYVSTCPDTGRQFLVQAGRDNNIIELTPANVKKIRAFGKPKRCRMCGEPERKSFGGLYTNILPLHGICNKCANRIMGDEPVVSA